MKRLKKLYLSLLPKKKQKKSRDFHPFPPIFIKPRVPR